MLNMGIPKEQIHKFADSREWLHYFPTAWQQHLQEFGCSIDWYVWNTAGLVLANGRNGVVHLSQRMRTSIMIHSYGKYFLLKYGNMFADLSTSHRWQVNRLKEMNKIQYGSRYTVYSPLGKPNCTLNIM
jgi:leucyl-tRNA synthetase